MIYGAIVYHKNRNSRGHYKGVDPTQFTAYSAAAPHNVELQTGVGQQQQYGVAGGSYKHQKDPRFEAYRNSSVPAPSTTPQYGAGAPVYTPPQTYDTSPQVIYQAGQHTGYVS
jgi:hypothetical protein